MNDTTTASTPETPAAATRKWRRPAVLIPAVVLVLGLLVVAALAFQPWRLVLDQTVDEAAPSAAVTPTAILSGQFISHEHDTQGTARVLETADGQRVLRLEGLRTSNGPDLKVWLADAPVLPGTDGWFVFDDGEYVDLGPLKGNVGNQNYAIPADVDLTELRSVAIWCDRFSVSFGAAELMP
jgi:hypothetical protein